MDGQNESSIDPTWVDQAIAGEPLALERLLMAHHRSLTALIDAKIPATLRSYLSAEDLLQETFTEAYRGIGAFRPDGPNAFIKWISTIAEHRVLDAIRAHKAAKRGGGRAPMTGAANDDDSGVLALLDLVAIHERSPSRSAAGHEAVSAVRSAIEKLKPDYRTAIQYRYLDGLSVADAAARMNRTERAIHKLCSRGLQRLRESLGDASKYLTRK